jgi:hypothetical protein
MQVQAMPAGATQTASALAASQAQNKMFSGGNQMANLVKLGLFVALIVCHGTVLFASPKERGTMRIRTLEFLGTSFFIMLACCTLDSVLSHYAGGKELIRPIKAAMFLPCYCLPLLLAARYPDEVFGTFERHVATPEGCLIQLTCTVMIDGVLAELCRWWAHMLVTDMAGNCPLLASAAGYVVPLILFVQQPNLRSRIEYLHAFLTK